MKKGVKLILLIICFVLLLGGGFYCIRYGTLRKTDDIDDNNDDFYSDANNLVFKTENALTNKSYKSLTLLDNKTTTIDNPGIYELSGTYVESNIVIDVEEEVILILNNVNLSNSSGAVIDVENAKAVLIYLLESSDNTIVSGEEVEITSSQDNQSGAAIYSKDNLYIAGKGTLIVNGYINNAIACNDSLLLLSGIYDIKAINNGIKAHDYLQIYDGTYDILSGNDGIKADNDEDTSLGNISIFKGDINITTYGDGISALANLIIEDGNITISSPNYSSNNSAVSSDVTRSTDDRMTSNIPNNDNKKNGNFFKGQGFGNGSNNSVDKTQQNINNNNNIANTDSNKGLKASNLIEIDGGTINITTSDDCIHSNNDIIINGGSYTLSCSDDGIHADNVLTINKGEIIIENSYEGIEGHQIYVNDATIDLYASDDGFNASGNRNCVLEFNGGVIYVNADGDGLDSNGDLIVNGGYIIVDGPTNSGNGPLDSGSENGGTLTVSGGELLAIGAKGMDESFDSTSTQRYIHLQTSSNYSAGSTISILNENKEIIFSYTSKKTFSSIVYTSSLLQEDKTYYVLINDDSYTLSTNEDSSNYNNNFQNADNRGNPFGRNRH